MAAINGINPIGPINPIGKPDLSIPSLEAKQDPNEFAGIFNQAIQRVEQYRIGAEASTNRFLNGENEEIHSVVLAGQRADIAFEAFVQVRNKIVMAYQEIMRMQM